MAFDRAQVEKILVLNGVEPTADDEEIRSVLVQARWDHEDVDAALMVLRENTETHETHVDTLHRVFRSDDALNPETINALLGIDVDFSNEKLVAARRHARGGMTFGQFFNIVAVSIVLALGGVFFAMWWFEVGFFHRTIL